MELKQIKHFIALSKAANFTKAAESCNISQPAFSQSIRKLEEELGGALVIRDGRNTRLTALGAVLLDYFERLRRAEEELKATARRETVGDRMRLWVQVDHVAGLGRATAAAAAFMAERRDVSVMVSTGATSVAETAYEDAPIIISTTPPPTARPMSRDLGPERFVAIAHPEHAFADLPAITPEQFFSEPVVRWLGCPVHRALEGMAGDLGVAVDFRLVAADFLLAKHFVASGFGVTMGPESLAQDGAVACAPLTGDPMEAALFASCELEPRADPRLRATVDAYLSAL